MMKKKNNEKSSHSNRYIIFPRTNFRPDIIAEGLVRLLNPIQLTHKCILPRKVILECSYRSFIYESTNNLLTHMPLKMHLKSMPIFMQNVQNWKFLS
jgi:hypothetical protein